MTEAAVVLIRMRDVGFALHAARPYRPRLNRTDLQKLVYLTDAVSLLFELYPPKEGHLTYKHGPYDASIQNAVDALAFRGLVDVASMARASDEGLASEYLLTASGSRWVRALREDRGAGHRWRATEEVTRRVDMAGWGRLVGLAYAEPTFVWARPRGFGQRLRPYDGLIGSTSFLLQTLDMVLRRGDSELQIRTDVMLDLFFDYLTRFEAASSGRALGIYGGGQQD